MNLKAEIQQNLHILVLGTQSHPHPDGSWTAVDEATTRLLQLFRDKAMEIVGDDEHMQHMSFHGRSYIRDELRHELRTKITEATK